MAAADRWQNRNLRASRKPRFQSQQMPDVIAVHEDRDVQAHVAALGDDAIAERGVAEPKLCERVGDGRRRAVERDRPFTVREVRQKPASDAACGSWGTVSQPFVKETCRRVLLFGFLAYVPPGASLILGVLYVWTAEIGGAVKIATAVTFVTALYLQFLSPWPLAGLLIQTVLALSLELRRRALA